MGRSAPIHDDVGICPWCGAQVWERVDEGRAEVTVFAHVGCDGHGTYDRDAHEILLHHGPLDDDSPEDYRVDAAHNGGDGDTASLES